MAEIFADLAISTLSSGVSSGATTITLQSGDGAKFPNPTSPDTFTVFIYKKLTGESEFLTCTARSGDVLTVSATSRSYNAGDVVENRANAAFYNSLSAVSSTNIQNGAFTYGTTSGSANTITVTMNPPVTSYTLGQIFTFIPLYDNTAAATVDFGAGSHYITDIDTAATAGAGTLRAGVPVTVAWNGGNFTLMSNAVSVNQPQTLTNKTLNSATLNTSTINTSTINTSTINTSTINSPTISGEINSSIYRPVYGLRALSDGSISYRTDTSLSVSKIGTGIYEITHSIGSTNYLIVATADILLGAKCRYYNISNTKFNMAITNSSDAFIDSGFSVQMIA